MNAKIVDIGRLIAFVAVIPMIGVAAIIWYTSLQNLTNDFYYQLLLSVGPGLFIWMLIAEDEKPSHNRSSTKDIIKALLIMFACYVEITMGHLIPLYDTTQLLINQTAAWIALLGSIVIIVGALA